MCTTYNKTVIFTRKARSNKLLYSITEAAHFLFNNGSCMGGESIYDIHAEGGVRLRWTHADGEG